MYHGMVATVAVAGLPVASLESAAALVAVPAVVWTVGSAGRMD